MAHLFPHFRRPRPQSYNSTNQVYEKSAHFREKGPAFFWPFIHSSIQQPCLTWPAIPGAPGEIDHSMVMAPFPPPLLLRSPCRWPMALLSSQTHSTRHSFCRIFCLLFRPPLLLRCQTDAPPFRYLIGFNKGPQWFHSIFTHSSPQYCAAPTRWPGANILSAALWWPLHLSTIWVSKFIRSELAETYLQLPIFKGHCTQ